MIKNFIKLTLGGVSCFVLFSDCEGMNSARIVRPVRNQRCLFDSFSKNSQNQNPNGVSGRKRKKRSSLNKTKTQNNGDSVPQEMSSLKVQIKSENDPVSILKTPNSNAESILEKKSVTFEQKLSENSQKLLDAAKDGSIYKVLASGCYQHEFSVEDFLEIVFFWYSKNEQEALFHFFSALVKAYHVLAGSIFYENGQRYKSSRRMISYFICRLTELKHSELLQMIVQADIDYRKTLSDSYALKNWHEYKWAIDYLIHDKKFNELEVLLKVLKRIYPNLSLQDLAYPSGINWFEIELKNFPELHYLNKKFFKD